MPKYEVFGQVVTFHKVEVCAKNKDEAQELATELFDESNAYETDSVEVAGVVKVRG